MDHIRIDEGVKRPKQQSITRRSPLADLGTWQIPPDLNPHEVLQRYLTAGTTSQIAAQYGLSRKALTKWLREVVPKEWSAVQLVRAHDLKEMATEDMAESKDALSLARNRELLRAAQYDLTALDKDYRPKTEVTVKEEIKIEVCLEGIAEELLKQLRTVATQQIEHKAESDSQPID